MGAKPEYEFHYQTSKVYVVTRNIHAVARAVVLLFLNYLAPRDANLGRGSLSPVIASTTLDTPVENIIVLITFTDEKISEKFSQIGVIRFVIETKSPGVVQKYAEFVGEPTAEEVRRGGHLLFHDAIVFLLLCSSFETLPWQCTAEEVHENVGKGLKVITTGLLDSQVSVYGCITSSTGEILVLPVRNVKMGLRVSELLGETKVDNIDLIASFADAHEEVVRLDVAMDKIPRMYVFDSRYLRKMA